MPPRCSASSQRVRRPSALASTAPIPDTRSQLNGSTRHGVCPRGAQVARMGGRCEKPLSSTKHSQALSLWAFFLPVANGLVPNERWPLRRVPWPVAPGAGGSSLTAGARAKFARGSNSPERPYRSPGRSAPASTVRCENPRRGDRAARPPPAAGGRQPRAEACVRPDQHLSTRRPRPAARLDTNDEQWGD